MGIIADIVEVLEAQKRDESRATPETVIALAVRKGMQAKQGENSCKDGEREIGGSGHGSRNEQRKGGTAFADVPGD